VELVVRAHNRTGDVQTFLCWANIAVQVHEGYQSFFPPDVGWIADHAKRATSTFPRCADRYYGVNYGARTRDGVPPNERPSRFVPENQRADDRLHSPDTRVPAYPPDDLSWYANIPVPTSYMCVDSAGDFCGGYDHEAAAGILHVADRHAVPGKKQWTWGNHAFGYAWDRNLTDPGEDGVCAPYIEIMAGAYTDNQPDFSFLHPGETRTWSQHFIPFRGIGPAQAATVEAALALSVHDRTARVGVATTAAHASVDVRLLGRDGAALAHWTPAVDPATPFVVAFPLPRGVDAEALAVSVHAADGRELVRFDRAAVPKPKRIESATEPPPPAEVASNDELFLTGLHLEQYRHATRAPDHYWREALARDPGDSRCHLALGRWHMRRGELELAENHLRAAVARLTFRNPNPYDGEAHYQLGTCLRHRLFAALADPKIRHAPAAFDAARAAVEKAAWNRAWQSPAFLALAEIDCLAADWHAAPRHLERALRADADNLRARNLLVVVLRRLGETSRADALLRETRALDPLDAWALHLDGRPLVVDAQVRIDLALDHARAGLHTEALEILRDAPTGNAKRPDASLGAGPLLHYHRAWLYRCLGDTRAMRRALAAARRTRADYCFPARLEEIAVLRLASAVDASDDLAPFLLGNLLYDKRRHREAIACWEKAVALDPTNAVAWRNLGLAAFNVLGDPRRARLAYERAFKAAPHSARLLYERDQLHRRLGVSAKRRLRRLEKHAHLVRERDDLSLVCCALHSQSGRPERALAILRSRRFQPWEGGEGVALGEHVRAHLLLGRRALVDHDASTALEHFRTALDAPENLGETRHPLANPSDVHFWIGEALHALGRADEARTHWRTAAEFEGDFQGMQVQTYSENTYYRALALRRLGRTRDAVTLLRALRDHARALARTEAKIDYFATSLPTMLLFDEDLQARRVVAARFLEAQALLGLGRHEHAARLLREILEADPSHALAADLLSETK
jgi:tetratricopeptide (TPR) repeat protein